MRKKIILTLLIAVMLLPAIALAGRPQPGDKGSLKNKLAILSVEAPGWQDAKAQEYQDISALSERSQTGCIGA